MNRFLTEKQMASLVEAIQTAEDHSTGEIRVHIDATTEGNNAQTAVDVFRRLNMHKTKERNAVLFHINFEQKYLTIIGDEGIHQKVSQQYWDDLHDRMTSMFAQGHYFEGVKNAILETGTELKKHFPINESGNPNELPNEITFS